MHFGAVRRKRSSHSIIVQPKQSTGFGVNGRCAVVKGQDRGGGRAFPFQQEFANHIGGFYTQISIVNAITRECAVEGKRVSPCIMGDAGLGEKAHK